MHPILTQRRRLSLYLFLFLQAGLLLGELLVRTAGAPRWQAMALAVPLLLIHSFSCLASWYLCRSLPLGATRSERLVITLLAAGVLSGGLVTAIGAALAWLMAQTTGFVGSMGFYRESVTLVFVFAVLVFSLTVAVHYLFIASEASRAAENRAFELRILAREAELWALKAQIDPHFLYNSLNSISGLVTADPQQARKMCAALADFLRQSLRVGELQSHPLADELALVDSYLAVEQIRFGERLRIERSMAEGCADCQVPPLILQPLVENAIRHGVAHLLDGGTVTLGSRIEAGRLRLRVENPCDPDRPRNPAATRSGIGLANVRQRLAAAFGTEGALTVNEKPDRFRVVATLPVRARTQRNEPPEDRPAESPAAAGVLLPGLFATQPPGGARPA